MAITRSATELATTRSRGSMLVESVLRDQSCSTDAVNLGILRMRHHYQGRAIIMSANEAAAGRIRRRAAPPHRHEGNLAGRAARSLHRAHRAHQSRGQRRHRDVLRARARRKRRPRRQAVLRGEPLGLLHGLPTGIKDLDETGGLLTTYGSPLYRDFVPERDNAMVARVRAAGAIVVGKTNVPEFGAGANTPQRRVGRDRQSVRSDAQCRRLVGRLGRRARDATCCRCARAPIPAARCASRRRNAASSVSARRPGWCRSSGARSAGRRSRSSVRWAARSPIPACCWRRRRRWTTAIRCRIRSTRARSPCPSRAISARCASRTPRISACRPVDAPIREVFRDKIAAMRHLFRSCDEVDVRFRRGGPLLRRDPRAELRGALSRRVRERSRARSAPTCAPTTRSAAGMTLADMAWAHAEQTRIFRRFQQTFRDYDLVLAPTTPVSPFPWTQLYLAEMDGKPLRNYYHWLSLTYVITLVTNPAICDALRRRSQGHAVRPAGRRAVSAATARCSARRTRWSRRSPRSPRCGVRCPTWASSRSRRRR